MTRSRSTTIFWIAPVLAALATAALIGAASRGTTPSRQQASHFWRDPSIRTIVIAGANEQLTGKGNVLVTELVAGQLPGELRKGTVLTDSNCAPDRQGISHCLNNIAIGASEVQVRHHHDMRAVPCLTPGETVNIIDVQTFLDLPSS